MKEIPTYFAYILHCADGTFYVGYTNDLDRRLKKHNGVLKGGAKYTRGRNPVKLHHVEAFTTKSEAMKREYELKQMTHQQKEALSKKK